MAARSRLSQTTIRPSSAGTRAVIAVAIAGTASLTAISAQSPRSAPTAPAAPSARQAAMQAPASPPGGPPPTSGADAAPGNATGKKSPGTGATSASAPYQPPVIRFDADGVSLAQAIDLTLEHEPTIKVQQSVLRQQRGAAQEQRGAFDTTLIGKLNYEYRQQELPQSTKDIENEKRTDLQEEIDINRRDYNKAVTLAEQLQAVRNAPVGPSQADAISAIDPDIGAQLRAMDLLISQQPDAAARGELQRIRNDYIDRTVGELQASTESLLTGFQDAERSLVNLGPTPEDEVFYNGGFDVQVGKRLRNGIFFAPFLNGQVEGSNFRDKPRNKDFGGKGLEDLFTFKAGVSSTIPILRGRGSDATGAGEKAARIGADASRFALQHQAAVSVLGTVRAYWALRAAQGSVEVATNSLALQDRLVELTRASIEAGELAQVELARVQASQARAQARLRDAERGVIDTRVQLAVAMGVAAEADDRTLPRARDTFPQLAGGAGPNAGDVVSLLSGAGTRRNDAKSSALLQDSSRVLERGAQTEMRPKLDLTNTTWFTALDERTVSNAIDRWVGPSTDFALEFERPFGNNERRGRYAQRSAEAQQRQIDLQNLQRQITLSVVNSAQALRFAQARADQARASAEAYRQTVDAEFERFRAGESTLIDAILTEGQMYDARQGLIGAEQELATLIAQLRFDAGTLVSFKGDQPIVNPADLVTAPGLTPGPGPTAPPNGGQQ